MKTKPINSQKIDNQSVFDGFIDEVFEYESMDMTDYYRGRLIAKFILKCGEYLDE